MEQAVLFEKKGAIGEIVLNRTEQMNAMNFALIEGIAAAVKECRDPSIRAVVLRGNGRCFCAGGDIKAFNQMIDEGKTIPPEMPDKLHAMVEELRNLEKPVLASVHAAAAGAGTPLALACDLVIASDDAIFNMAYARIGLTADGSSTYFLPRHVGMKKAFEILLTIPTLKAKEAQELGLINWVVPAAELVERTQAIAQQLAAGPTKVFAKTKKLLNASYHNNLHDQLALETAMICESSQTADFREGIKAFLGKKTPTFVGK
jgi:2-(1,2-epoxy-1,2-dihydrophenyl)acetyl-CoA isomerase